MTCEETKRSFALLLYGELSFDEEEQVESHLESCGECRHGLQRERAMHEQLYAVEARPPFDMLARSREQLRRSLAAPAPARESLWQKLRNGFTIHVHPIPAGLQPVGAIALIAMGFFAARMIPASKGTVGTADLAPMTSRVRYVEPGKAGKVQVVVEDTRERILSGAVDDRDIQALLLAASRDPQDAGLRVESVDLLKGSRECPQVRDALLNALQHDSNPGVRLKALEGLKNLSADAQVRQVLTQVLLNDENAGVRKEAIDLLIQQKEDRMVGVLQELLRKEDNGYIRLRCQKALHDMNASVETY
jgi:hypothetical protein